MHSEHLHVLLSNKPISLFTLGAPDPKGALQVEAQNEVNGVNKYILCA